MADSRIVVEALRQRVFDLPGRDKDWEQALPPAYVPLDHYEGSVLTEWQERWDRNHVNMRSEDLPSEMSHFAVTLAPRSPRTQYGLDLTRALLHRIEEVLAGHQAKLVIFQVDTHSFASEDQMQVLNGKYYRVSKRQFDENFEYVHKGLDTHVIPVTINPWRVSPDDGHLNQAATDQIMEDLARKLLDRAAKPT
jgi:hypothetical protein